MWFSIFDSFHFFTSYFLFSISIITLPYKLSLLLQILKFVCRIPRFYFSVSYTFAYFRLIKVKITFKLIESVTQSYREIIYNLKSSFYCLHPTCNSAKILLTKMSKRVATRQCLIMRPLQRLCFSPLNYLHRILWSSYFIWYIHG